MEKTAHKLEEKERTNDVKLSENVPFSKMVLLEPVRKGLRKAGYVYPTVIQANAINLGKAGIDLVVQSKSGTGKTLIFATILLESFRSDIHEPQSLIIVPTREIAVQIENILNVIGCYFNTFKAVSVIGGLDVVGDRKKIQNAAAVVGTPGRVVHLIQNNVLNTSKLRLLVIDEADKMMSQSFKKDFEIIFQSLPRKKHIIACSATFSGDLDKELAKLMRSPLLISTEKQATVLIGIKQMVYEIPEERTNILQMNAKLAAMKHIFSSLSFKQCLVFTNSQSRGESYRNLLEKDEWSCEAISGGQDQKTRLEKFKKFREFKTRILIATDLMSRGVDSEHVNLVINLDLPADRETYLHRIGRAGRFGSHGIAITLISSDKDSQKFSSLLSTIAGMNILKFPKECSTDLWNFSNPEEESKALGLFAFNRDQHAKDSVNNNSPTETGARRNSLYEEEIKIDKNFNLLSGFQSEEKDEATNCSESSSTSVSSQQCKVDSRPIKQETTIPAVISNDIDKQKHSEDLNVDVNTKKDNPSTVHTDIRHLLMNSDKNIPSLDVFEDFKSFKCLKATQPVKNHESIKNNIISVSHCGNSSNDGTLDAISSITPTEKSLATSTCPEAKRTKTKSKISQVNTIQQPSTSTSERQQSPVVLRKLTSPTLPPLDEEKRTVTPVKAIELQRNSLSQDAESRTSNSDETSSRHSSGFDEKTTSARSSGVVTTETSDSSSDSDDDSCDYTLSSPDESSDTLESQTESSSECENEIAPRKRRSRNTAPNRSNLYYHSNYTQWTHLYWNQMTRIQDYTRFSRYVRETAPRH